MYSSTWNFTSYEKIDESFHRWQIDEAGHRLLEKIDWVVTEKIHGANFCFVTDGQVIRCANRKKFLDTNENFFDYQKLQSRLNDNIKRAFIITQSKHPQISRIFIYGELFGGSYPHPDVTPDLSVQPVQTGIYYSPTIEFCAFDIAFESDGATRTYLDYDKAIDILQSAGIFYAVPLFIGRYNEAIAFEINFSSTIPPLLNLPPLHDENKAEGIVIKPIKIIYIDTPKGKIRPVLKRKITEFSEEKRFHLAEKWSEQSFIKQDDLEILQWSAFNLITENSLRNAISKIGYIKPREKSRARELFNLVIEDVIEQLSENQELLLKEITQHDKNQLLAFIKAEMRKLLKNYFDKETRRV
ncbi:hypothetical protein NIES4075_34520 [Tolypothrix sp. NIES-4075]|uniref:RNA ligase family protein n=1 Tax=Tolypothrix sp. NIES-4075 TaxID=2005459 RepID=UPI000B5C8363|nr:RNA ligase family protein [Tolypothrix sp. NIES-4075]GAX42451.1 hypothetical protein NIES4075_34520 [Tolypothrix sp. NIES-4075]